MSGTLTITSPATDNEAGHDSSLLKVVWSFTGDGTATQVQRRVTMQRTGSPELLIDTGMQASTSTAYTVSNLNSGTYYTVTVSVLDTSGTTTSTSRTIVSRYVRSLPPTVATSPVPNGIAVTITNPGSGDRPPITSTQIYRRRAGSRGPWTLVTVLYPNGTFVDREVRSGTAYEYFGRGFVDPNAKVASGIVAGYGTLSAQLGAAGGAGTVDNAVVDLSVVGASQAGGDSGGGANTANGTVAGRGTTSGAAQMTAAASSTSPSGGATTARTDSAVVDRDLVAA